ncbi:MAG: hypothetical protein AAF633_02000 [Chloroflexota bacterium]
MKKIMNFRIFGFPIVIAFVATCWMLIVSWLWTGSLFNGINIPAFPDWLALQGLEEADVDGMPLGWQLLGILGVYLQTAGLIILMRWRNRSGYADAAQTAFVAALFFAIPIVMLPMVFRPDHNVTLFLIEAGKYGVSWVSTALILTWLTKASAQTQTDASALRSAVSAK